MNRAKDRKGFTLIELLVVIGIIALLAGILVPNLLKSRKTANEKAVISTMKSIMNAETVYHMESGGRYASLDALESGRYLGLGVRNRQMTGGLLTGFEKSNYRWTFSLGSPATRFSIAASPLTWDADGSAHFYMDESGVVRHSTVQGTAAGSSSPVIE